MINSQNIIDQAHLGGLTALYRPNFCAECGAKIIRLQWRFWTSRTFCDICANHFLKERVKSSAILVVALIGLGYVAGRAGRPASPPLTIERAANSPLSNPQTSGVTVATSGVSVAPVLEEQAYICGARTRKGTPCSR